MILYLGCEKLELCDLSIQLCSILLTRHHKSILKIISARKELRMLYLSFFMWTCLHFPHFFQSCVLGRVVRIFKLRILVQENIISIVVWVVRMFKNKSAIVSLRTPPPQKKSTCLALSELYLWSVIIFFN